MLSPTQEPEGPLQIAKKSRSTNYVLWVADAWGRMDLTMNVSGAGSIPQSCAFILNHGFEEQGLHQGPSPANAHPQQVVRTDSVTQFDKITATNYQPISICPAFDDAVFSTNRGYKHPCLFMKTLSHFYSQ